MTNSRKKEKNYEEIWHKKLINKMLRVWNVLPLSDIYDHCVLSFMFQPDKYSSLGWNEE